MGRERGMFGRRCLMSPLAGLSVGSLRQASSASHGRLSPALGKTLLSQLLSGTVQCLQAELKC